jgi:sulfur-carrier protein adenylyltransferase/sulfurtransferase
MNWAESSFPGEEFAVSTFDKLIKKVKDEIRETDVHSVYERLESGEDFVLVDIREREEVADGVIAGAERIPRSFLDMRIEKLVSDKTKAVVLYCAGGTRSALGTRTLLELGYENVESMSGGFAAWKQAGLAFEIPKTFRPDQLTRYSRHLIIPEVGEAGQRKLLDSRVLMLGAGGLGSPAALYLAAAGVGTIGIIDSDVVDRSNLQRQILHTDARVGEPKVDSAELTLKALNPDVEVVKFNERLSSENVLEIFSGWDLLVDGGDNFPTRYLINDVCVHLGIPNVHGSVYRFEGQVTTFVPREGPCYRCLYPEPPPPEFAPSCQEAGVLGVLPGIIGLLQAIEVIKLLLGVGEPLTGRLLVFDGLKTQFKELRLQRDPHCARCSDGAVFEGFIDYEQFCNVSV